jgi:signal transduction histidine kinase
MLSTHLLRRWLLSSNSLKFKGDKPPVINVGSVKDGDNVLLSVQDNGIGLSKADKSKIFELYGRLHHDIEGQGIGLYLAKKMVDAAGGNIIVESEPGMGTKIITYFKSAPEVVNV